MSNALNMAIKELQQYSCKDCVSRQAVLDMVTVIVTDDYSGNEIMEVVDVDDIKALPPVTLAKPKGHWINIDKTHSKCDKCGAVFEIASANGEANYCPNCGCKISEGGKENEY